MLTTRPDATFGDELKLSPVPLLYSACVSASCCLSPGNVQFPMRCRLMGVIQTGAPTPSPDVGFRATDCATF